MCLQEFLLSTTFLAMVAVFICTACRFSLNIVDRTIFRDSSAKKTFHFNIFLCCLIPFLFAFITLITISSIDGLVKQIFSDWAFWNGLALFATGTSFCYGFSKMKVKSVVTLSKLSDFVTPWLLILLVGKFDLNALLFNFLLIFSFFPIIYRSMKSRDVHYKSLFLILLSLVFQCFIIQYMFSKSSSLSSFLVDFCSTSFWRLMFGSFFFVLSGAIKKDFSTNFSDIKVQIVRGLPAFLAQASHLYALTISPTIALYTWPIINSSPIIASSLAHLFLQEKMKKSEYISCLLFSGVSILWITIKFTN